MRTELFRLSDTPVTPLSIVILLVTLLLTLVLGSLARRALTRALSKRSAAKVGLAYAIGRITQYAVVMLGVVFALDNFGLDLGALAAVGAVLSLGIGFGLQNIVQNFISGLILLIERPVQKGDFVVAGDTVGTVTEIEMRATKIVSRDGVAIIVPNSQLITATVVNQTQPSSKKRVSVQVSVAYGTDTGLVKQTLHGVADGHPEVLKEPRAEVFFKSFGDSALDFELAVWLDHPEPELTVASDLRFAIDRAFRDKKIEIPFPQRDVHLRSGVVGAGGSPRQHEAEGVDRGGEEPRGRAHEHPRAKAEVRRHRRDDEGERRADPRPAAGEAEDEGEVRGHEEGEADDEDREAGDVAHGPSRPGVEMG
jgi:small-conductance mechanosensitive channel